MCNVCTVTHLLPRRRRDHHARGTLLAGQHVLVPQPVGVNGSINRLRSAPCLALCLGADSPNVRPGAWCCDVGLWLGIWSHYLGVLAACGCGKHSLRSQHTHNRTDRWQLMACTVTQPHASTCTTPVLVPWGCCAVTRSRSCLRNCRRCTGRMTLAQPPCSSGAASCERRCSVPATAVVRPCGRLTCHCVASWTP